MVSVEGNPELLCDTEQNVLLSLCCVAFRGDKSAQNGELDLEQQDL